MALNQAYLFLIFMFTGMVISILFDMFRVLRRSFKTPDIIIYIEDILFWILAGCITLYVTFRFNNGEIRAYLFMGIGVGVVIYLLTLSKYFININLFILGIIKKTITTIFHVLLKPLKGILHGIQKIFYKPILFTFVNFRQFFMKNIRKMEIKHKKIKNNAKKTIQNEKINI